MDGPKIFFSGSLGNPGPTEHLVGSGDFDGDGTADFLFQSSDGEVDIIIADTGVFGTPGNPGPSWHVIGTGDYNGDGHSDIVYQDSSSDGAIEELDGTTVI